MNANLTYFTDSDHLTNAFYVLRTMRNDHILCDVTLIIDEISLPVHKMVLAACSPYFHAMFTSFEESSMHQVCLQELDAKAVTHLVDYCYSGHIEINEDNVQSLLPAANLLQLESVKIACCNFLESQLHPTNCLGIKSFADLHGCLGLLRKAQQYAEQKFSEVIEEEEFLQLSFESISQLISSDHLVVSSEEKVLECVISWIRGDIEQRKQFLTNLLQHVKLPLLSRDCILDLVGNELICSADSTCKDLIIEALHYHLLRGEQRLQIKSQRTKPRQPVSSPQVLYVVGGQAPKAIRSVECYDIGDERWYQVAELSERLAVLENKIYAVGGFNGSVRIKTVEMYDPHLDSWISMPEMHARRSTLGVAILEGMIYAVGGFDGSSGLNTAECFDALSQQWHTLSSMTTRRSSVGVGVINDLLYAVGGYDGLSRQCLNSVECYDSTQNTWYPVAEMAARRSGAGVGVLNGVLFAIGGHDGPIVRQSVEAYDPRIGKWMPIGNMNFCRRNAGIAVIDNSLYVVGGDDGVAHLSSIEVYCARNNIWMLLPSTMAIGRSYAGVAALARTI